MGPGSVPVGSPGARPRLERGLGPGRIPDLCALGGVGAGRGGVHGPGVAANRPGSGWAARDRRGVLVGADLLQQGPPADPGREPGARGGVVADRGAGPCRSAGRRVGPLAGRSRGAGRYRGPSSLRPGGVVAHGHRRDGARQVPLGARGRGGGGDRGDRLVGDGLPGTGPRVRGRVRGRRAAVAVGVPAASRCSGRAGDRGWPRRHDRGGAARAGRRLQPR